MPGERREPQFIEPIDPQLEQSWFKIIDALIKQTAIELYAVDAANPADFVREQGSGQLKLSENGDLQIKQGKNWRVVKTLDVKLQERLRLDEPSVRALAEYLQKKPKIEPYRHPPKETVATVEESAERKELILWRLEKLAVPGYLNAERLISRILQGAIGRLNFIDITDNKPGGGREEFCRAWKKSCGDLPLPCVPPEALFEILYPGQKFPGGVDRQAGNFDYLTFLVDNRVVKNNSSSRQIIHPYFNRKETIYVMDWEEDDNSASNASGRPKLFSRKYESPLLDELGLSKDGVMRIDRQEIDVALWENDPGVRQQTKKHREILQELDINDNEWEIHCIRQDQYARLAKAKNWGQHQLLTHFDDYILYPSGLGRHGLVGGHVDYGGASHIGDLPRDNRNDLCATRLVISRKRYQI